MYYDCPTQYLTLVSDSAVEPVATTDIKRQVNLPTTYYGDDEWIGSAITAARKLVEKRIGGGRALVNQTWDLVLDKFPPSNERLLLPNPPLSSVTSIVYYNITNVSTTMASTDYQVHTPTDLPGFILPRVDGYWPSSKVRPNAVTIRFVAGYGSGGASVPGNLRHAIKMLCGHWYENREAVAPGVASELPLGVEALLQAGSYGHYA